MGHNFEVSDASGSKKAPTNAFEGEIQKQTEPPKLAQSDAAPKAADTPAAEAPKQPELSPLAKKSVDAMNSVSGAADTALKGIVDGTTKIGAVDKLSAADQTSAKALIGKLGDTQQRGAAFKELSAKHPAVAAGIVEKINQAADKVFQGNVKTFEDGITAADANYETVAKASIDEFQKKGADGLSLEDKAKAANKEVDAGTVKAQAAFEKLAPKDQQAANALVEQLQDPAKAAAAMTDLTTKYPTVAEGIKEATDAMTKNKDVFDAVNKLEENMGKAAEDSVLTRQAYMNALKMSGNGGNEKASTIGLELMMMQFGATPSELKKEQDKN